MEDVFNTPHTCKVELEVLGHKLLLAQDPNSKHLGTTVWDSSIVFVKYLEKNSKKGEFCRAKLHGKHVIELGAGCGLSGLGMALLGCDVVVTDQVAVLPILIRNMERNMARAKYSASEYPHLGLIGSVEVAELDWGNHLQVQTLKPPFDYIIGTDVVYKEYLLPPLLESVLALSGPKTTLLMGYEFRASGVREQLHELFSRHFEIKKIPHSKMDAKYQHPNIDLFIMRYKDSSTSSVKSGSPVQEEKMLSQEQELLLRESSAKCDNSDFDTDNILKMKTREGSTPSLPSLPNANLSKKSMNVTNKDRCDSYRSIQESEDLHGMLESSSTDWEEVSGGSCVRDWEAGRLGSMAARLLQDVQIPLNKPSWPDQP